MPQVSFTKSLPKLLVPKVLVAWVWMPAGEAQRMRLKVNDAWFFWLMFQSTLGKMMNCSPSRGVGPSMLTRPLNSLEYRVCALAVLMPFLVAIVDTALADVACPKKMVELLGIAVPGKLRLYQSKVRFQKSLSLMAGPPTPKPDILRQSVGLSATGGKLPDASFTVSLVNGLVAPQTLSRS